MDVDLETLVTILALALVHVFGPTLHREWGPRALSVAAGIGVAYVFLDLIPDLAERQFQINSLGIFPGLERHVYILALVGLAVAFWVETASRRSSRRHRDAGELETGLASARLSIATFMILNAAIGYAVASPDDKAVEPLWMFAVAMGLHFLVNDHSLAEHHGRRYQRVGRWFLVGALLTGWTVGSVPNFDIPPAALALVLAYVAGGTIMNTLRHELPNTDRHSEVAAFVLGAAVFAVFLLSSSTGTGSETEAVAVDEKPATASAGGE